MDDTNTEELYSLEKMLQEHLNKPNLKLSEFPDVKLKNKMLKYYCDKGKQKRGLV